MIQLLPEPVVLLPKDSGGRGTMQSHAPRLEGRAGTGMPGTN